MSENTRRRRWERTFGSVDDRTRRLVVIGLLVLVVTFVVGYAVTAAVFYSGTSYPDIVNVPELRTLDAAAARRAVERLGLELEVGDSLPNPEIAVGAVIAQSPLPGREVPPGTPVRVMLSSGAPRRPLPSVEAMFQAQAVALLEAAGFTVTVEQVEDPAAAGRVIGTSPTAGTPLQLASEVRLRVSAGPPLVEVPSLVGMEEAAARAAIGAAGLRVGEVHHIFSFRPDGEVLGQEPAPGDSIRAGSRIELRIGTQRLPGEPIRDPNTGAEEVREVQR